MRNPAIVAILGLLTAEPSLLLGQEITGVRPLLVVERDKLQSLLPSDTHLLVEPAAIQQFLNDLEGKPPDWPLVYGQGHHDPGHDDRLFNLNRERDARREGKLALRWNITFLWFGELSGFDPKTGGFSVALGPKFTLTLWGVVRFKPENLPANLMVIPNPSLRESLRRKFEKGQPITIDVAMTGTLVPDEPLVYDFSHEEEGRGLTMPVVRIERVDYLMVKW